LKRISIDKDIQGSQLLVNRRIVNNLTGEYMFIGGNELSMDYDSTILTQFRSIVLKHNFECNPYNSNILVFTTFSVVDTVGDKKEFILRDNLFTFNIQTKKLQLITPSELGKSGAIIKSGLGMNNVKWLSESSLGNDVFFIRYEGVHYKYYLQTDKLEQIGIEAFTVISNDIKLRFFVNYNFPNSNTQKY